MNFPEQIDKMRDTGQGPIRLNIDLADAAIDREFAIAGNHFYVWDAPDETSYVDIKINRNSPSAFPFVRGMGLDVAFSKLYITTPAGQTGTLVLLIETEDVPLFNVIDNRSATVGSLSDIADELKGDTTHEDWGTEETVGTSAVEIIDALATRKAFSIQSKASNTGQIYLGFDNTVTSSKWIVELSPGQAFVLDDYRGAIFAISDTAGQLVGWGEW